ncbi:hypothetical protein D6D27_06289 [Aureobasidium pullulans]|nr:hypothetical protein D6D27_06289 [Aureobasidium pullulans]
MQNLEGSTEDQTLHEASGQPQSNGSHDNGLEQLLSVQGTRDESQEPLINQYTATKTPAAVDSTLQPLLQKVQPLGKILAARVIGKTEIVALAISVLSMMLAVATVANDNIAWYLRFQYQIVVVGLLLSLMNICMMTVLPTTLLRCEALLGDSAIQNFEAIVRNRPLASKTAWTWRLVLAALIALPLGLSVLYKLFKDGAAVLSIEPENSLYNTAFGLFAPPGLLPLGWDSGTILMYNITMPFLMASTNQTAPRNANTSQLLDPLDEVILPATWPQTYGFNTLLLNNSTAALLDVPPPDWITNVQNSLKDGDHLDIAAPVLATVASRNHSVDAHRNESSNSDFWAEFGLDKGLFFQDLFNDWYIGMKPSFLNASVDRAWCFVSIQAGKSVPSFISTTQLWELNRVYCSGRWRVTRAGTKLLNGTCDTNDRPAFITKYDQPELILTRTGNAFSLNVYFLPALNEFLAPFDQSRNDSDWVLPTMATSVANMYWSRLAAMEGPGSPHWTGNNSFAKRKAPRPNDNITDGLLYGRSASVESSRPTLQKATILYIVFVVQPFITLVAIIADLFMWDVPIGSGFNMVTVLAGADEKRDLLAGAGYSGELRRPLYMEIVTEEQTAGAARLIYRFTDRKPQRLTRLVRKHLYS